MVGYFPVPYPDELFYSVVGRFFYRHGEKSPINTLEKLFGAKGVRLLSVMPTHLTPFIKQLPPNYPLQVADFIEQHSHLPAYIPFLPSDRLEKVRTAMLSTGGSGLNIVLGLVASGIKTHRQLMYCPGCVEQDRQVFGESFWHRQHQFPGIHVCAVHQLRLKPSSVCMDASRQFVRLNDLVVGVQHEKGGVATPEDRDSLFLAQQIQTLLDSSIKLTYPEIRSKYIAELIKHKLATFSGNVKTRSLLRAFQERFTPDFLTVLGCEIENKAHRNWVTGIVQENALQHPLRHLVLLCFLGLGIEDFAKTTAEMAFESGPYRCLNKICDYYQERVIATYQLGFSIWYGRRPKGMFECPHCGYAYSRIAAIDTHDHKPQVVRYGAKWDARLVQLWTDERITQQEAVQALGVGIDTLQRQAKRLGITYHQLITQEAVIATQSETDYRQLWLQALSDHPGCGVAFLQANYPAIFRALYAKDAEWLFNHKPADVRRINPTKGVRTDWVSRDQDYCERIKILEDAISSEDNKPRRITCNVIGKTIGLADGSLPRDIKKLPATSALVASLVESHEQFVIRRIHHVIALYQSEKVIPTTAALIKRAGISLAMQTDVILRIVEQVLAALSADIASMNESHN